MTCDVARNRLLALPDPARPTDDLAPHLGECDACRRVQAEAVRLDRLLRRLPVPTAGDRKAAFLAELDAAGPVIRSRPVLPSTLAGSGAFKPVTRWLKRMDWRYVGGGVAAAAAVGLGLFFLAPRKTTAPPDQVERPRSVLLGKVVRHNTALAGTARTPDRRLGVYAEWTADVKAEACDVYKVAGADEMNSLATQYEQVVQKGVVGQATRLDDKPLPPDERSAALQDAVRRLAAAETDAARLAPDAPPNARDALNRISAAAKDGRQTLTKISEGK